MNTQLIVALDVDRVKEAKAIVNRLGTTVKFYKVGSQLFSICGPEIIRWLKAKKKSIFLDLKLHDIPNTVANTARAITRLGVSMFTIHAGGGQKMMRACVKAVNSEAKKARVKKPRILAVTVLTSQKSSDTKDKVLQSAKQAISCGVEAIVCSVNEASILRKQIGKNIILVCPGIRLGTSKRGDQKRVATPAQAKQAAVNFIVVGRPVLEARSPFRITANILNELKV